MKNDVWYFSFIFRGEKESHLQHFENPFLKDISCVHISYRFSQHGIDTNVKIKNEVM